MRLAGQVALVTGGGTGIGRAISLAFAREGAPVVVNHSSWPKSAFEAGKLEVATADIPTTEDCADAALFLASSARATTGTTFFVDGGLIGLQPRTPGR